MIYGIMNKKHTLEAMSALSHEGRLDVFRLLVRAAPQGMYAGDIAAALDVRANTLSANLTILSNAGLVQGEREGRNIRYRADMDAMRGMLAFLLEDCCGGSPELCQPVLDEIACRC